MKPLALIEKLGTIESRLKSLSIPYRVIDDENILNIEVNHQKKDFYFIIDDIDDVRFEPFYSYRMMPSNQLSFKQSNYKNLIKDMVHHFNEWIDLVIDYKFINVPFSDSYDKIYAEQFYLKLDSMASSNSLENKIEKIDAIGHIQEIEEKLIRLTSDIYREELIAFIRSQKKIIDSESAGSAEINSSLANIYGKIYKFGYPLFEGVVGNGIYDVLKKIAGV